MIIIQFLYGSLTSWSFKYKLYYPKERDTMPENKIKQVHAHVCVYIYTYALSENKNVLCSLQAQPNAIRQSDTQQTLQQ